MITGFRKRLHHLKTDLTNVFKLERIYLNVFYFFQTYIQDVPLMINVN